jgi:hypothetical protein
MQLATKPLLAPGRTNLFWRSLNDEMEREGQPRRSSDYGREATSII